MLLFSTMTGALDVIASFLSWRGFEHLQLDGRTRPQDRGDIVNRFNDTGQTPRDSLLQPSRSPRSSLLTKDMLLMRRGVRLAAQRTRYVVLPGFCLHAVRMMPG